MLKINDELLCERKKCNEIIIRLQKFEEKYNFSLPKDYKEFIINNNAVELFNVEFKSNGLLFSINRIYGFDDEFDLEQINRLFEWELTDLEIIFGDSGDGVFVINILTNEITYIDDTMSMDCSTEFSYTYHVCNSFTEFISLVNIKILN